MKTIGVHDVQYSPRAPVYGICPGMILLLLVGALTFFVAFGYPTVLAKNVLVSEDIFFRLGCYLWITGATWVIITILSQRRRTRP